ncbi:MAG TPA: FAD-dependent oxidoreductase [Candidatus Cloacimonadota bacterium]|nr:FAD-dependent oxidoreductase [Candidatus Cloacimonadota bacterium]
MLTVKLNGNNIQVEPGKTILQVAKDHGIYVPTLCHDEELHPYGSCWVCAVEVKGRRGFVTACGTEVLNGMEIETDNEAIRNARKMALELLLSNHYADCEAPCKNACPDHVDVQGYVSLIANGQYHEAVKVLKDTLPMPLSIGRVCPAFCERECRRQIVEESVAIRQLKRYAADQDLNDAWSYKPERDTLKGKKVAVIGGGPSGLTCGFYLTTKGYDVDVIEGAPAAGGWLRYGIPEYRLPKAILDKEIELMCCNGMKIHTNHVLGRDHKLSDLSKKYDAVYVAIGAQKAVPMPVQGSDLEGCYLGVDFLKDVALGKQVQMGKKVAVVGGGNTAIDCARTSVRLGADVTIIYRRTREEMPAEPFEIEAAGHEGVHFHFLTNPVEYLGNNGILTQIKMEKMALGAPDSSGRRRPEPTGEHFIEEFDMVIAAISQVPDIEVFADQDNYIEGKQFPLSRWSTALADEDTMYMNLGNVFAGGDFRRGAATAIEAIADGRRAAEMIDLFLQGMELKKPRERFDSKKAAKVKDVLPEVYAQYEKITRAEMPEIEVKKAMSTFTEVELGFNQESAHKEADRCLECGCQVNETCYLRKYATDYDASVELLAGDNGKHPVDESHPFIRRDANKCIVCGRCVRVCAEVQGANVLGYMYRGFPSMVAPEFGDSLTKTTCESCGKCISVCPVGALTEKNVNYKMNPLCKTETLQNCGNCGTGCFINVESETQTVTRITPPCNDNDYDSYSSGNYFNGRNICFYGHFGWQAMEAPNRVHVPHIRKGDKWEKISWEEAAALVNEKAVVARNHQVFVSPNISNEEILMLKDVSDNLKADISCLGYPGLFTDQFINTSILPRSFDELKDCDTIVIIGTISHTLRTMCRLQQRKGKKLVVVEPKEIAFNRFADARYDRIQDFARDIEKYSRSFFIYSIHYTAEETILKFWRNSSWYSDFKTGTGIMATSEWSNLNGILSLGIQPEKVENAEFQLYYGQTPAISSGVQNVFQVAFLTHMDESIPVDMILPLPSYLEMEGTSYSDEGRLVRYHNPKRSLLHATILSMFVELGWIAPIMSEPQNWLNRTEKYFNELVKTDLSLEELRQALGKITNVKTSVIKNRGQARAEMKKLKEMTHK